MRLSSLYRLEINRLALSKIALVFGALSLCAPLFGYSLFIQSSPFVMSGQYIANPVLSGTVIGAIIWAVLTLMETDRVYRTKTDVLVDAVFSPVLMAFIRISALITFSIVVWFICALIYLPYTIIKMDYLFDFGVYANSFLFIMLLTWWISILLASALYQILRRIELAAILYAVCVYFSISRFALNNFFARWLNPLILTYSDGFSSSYYIRIALYTRIIWFILASGVWTLSLLCIRRYEKNLLGSFCHGLRKFIIPLSSMILLSVGVLLWTQQPFVDHGPAEFQDSYQYNDYSATVSEITYRLTAKPSSGRLHGVAEYKITKSGTLQDYILLSPGYSILNVTCDEKEIAFEKLQEFERNSQKTVFTLPKGNNQTLIIEYEGYPTMLRCFSPYTWGNEVTDNYVSLSNDTSVPLASFSNGISCTLELTLPNNLTPIVNHELLSDFVSNIDNSKTWRAKIPTDYFLWITAGDYIVEPLTIVGSNIDFIYSSI